MGIVGHHSIPGTGTIYDAFEGTQCSGHLPALCLELLDPAKGGVVVRRVRAMNRSAT